MSYFIVRFKQGILITLGLCLCVWLVFQNLNHRSNKLKVAQKPQAYMKQVLVWRYAPTGQLKDHIQSPYWAYSPEKKASRLSQPNLIFYKPNAQQWQVRADYALVHHDKLDMDIESIDLWDAVEVKRQATKTQEPLSLTTTYLHYEPKTQALRSNVFVTLTKPHLKMTGIGLKGNLKQNQIQLQKSVKTEYRGSA